MMIQQLLKPIFLLCVTGLIVSCEGDNNIGPIHTKKLKRVSIFHDGIEGRQSEYSYNEDGKLIQAYTTFSNNDTRDVRYIYEGDLLQQVSVSRNSQIPVVVETYSYDDNNRLTTAYFYDSQENEAYKKETYSYTDNQISEVKVYVPTQEMPIARSEYIRENGNVIKEIRYINSALSQILTRTFDEFKNPYHNMGTYNMRVYNYYNNIINISFRSLDDENQIVSSSDRAFEYGADGYPTKQTIGSSAILYEYEEQ